jgi:hypothetical protein
VPCRGPTHPTRRRCSLLPYARSTLLAPGRVGAVTPGLINQGRKR